MNITANSFNRALFGKLRKLFNEVKSTFADRLSQACIGLIR